MQVCLGAVLERRGRSAAGGQKNAGDVFAVAKAAKRWFISDLRPLSCGFSRLLDESGGFVCMHAYSELRWCVTVAQCFVGVLTYEKEMSRASGS
jgi:hypothetical protein